MRRFSLLPFASLGLLVAAASPASSAEYSIGEPQVLNGMEIAAVYLQPIEMDPPGMMTPAPEADIHLEADIHATADNKNGFAEGDWLPNLHVTPCRRRSDVTNFKRSRWASSHCDIASNSRPISCSAKRSNMLPWTVRSWRIVGSGGCGFVFRISGLMLKCT